MKRAAATGDIATVIRLMTTTARLTPADYIRKTVGEVMFMYYAYIDAFHTRPADIMDMIDGLLYLTAKSYISKREMEESASRAKKG